MAKRIVYGYWVCGYDKRDLVRNAGRFLGTLRESGIDKPITPEDIKRYKLELHVEGLEPLTLEEDGWRVL